MTVDDLDAWHAWRAQGLGGSDVAAVLGISPWSSPYSLWAEKVGLVDNRSDSTEAQEFGKRAEAMLAQWFHDKTGLWVHGEQAWCVHPDKPWMRCTIDGMVCEPGTDDTDLALGVLEIKTTIDSQKDWADEVPVYYACQATWNMLVTGTTRCWFAVLHMAFGRPRFEVYEFTLDPSDAAFVEQACETFWLQHVVTGLPPEVDGSDATTDTLAAMWPDAAGGVEATDEVLRAIIEREQWAQTKEMAEAEVERLSNVVRIHIGDAEQLVDATGKKLASWKFQDTTRLDTKALRAELPELVAPYLNTTRSRVLRFPPKPKEKKQ